MAALSSLPAELIIRILLYPPPASLCACQQTSRSLHAVITSSDTLQYRLALYKHGMNDNSLCPLATSTKHSMLEQRELAWRNFELISRRSIFTSSLPLRIPGLSQDFFFGIYRNSLGLRRMPLSAESDVEPRKWMKTTRDRILSYGIAIDEHNLIVLVAWDFTIAVQQQYFTFSLLLCDFTTGEPHSLAQSPVLSLTTSSAVGLMHDYCMIKVSGENLVFAFQSTAVCYEFHIWNWFTGLRKVKKPFPTNGAAFIFLREDLILIPQATTFDIYHIPYSSNAPIPSQLVPFLRLSLPSNLKCRIMSDVLCRTDTASTLQGFKSPGFVSHLRPYMADPIHELELFNINVLPCDQMINYTMMLIVRKTTLLSLASKAMDTKNSEEPWSTSDPSIVQSIPWSSWGPSASRWIDGAPDKISAFCTTSSGQRFVFLAKEGHTGQTYIKVLDFNPNHIRDFKAKGLATKSEEHANIRLVDADGDNGSPETLESIAIDAILTSKLPYIEMTFKRPCDYFWVVNHEEHLIGMANGRITIEMPRIDPIHFE